MNQNQSNALDLRCINTIRTLSIDAIQKANSGHPGLPLGAAPMAYVLWDRYLKHNPTNPAWADRDRFVLSAGHGSMLLYSLLFLTGYGLTLDELKEFRQWESRTPGHPERLLTPGVEATTGPLGQGVANAVGMAIAERRLAARFNRPGHEVVDHFTYALVSDGDLMEGVSAEACSLAGHLKLGKLILLYDSNDVTLDGPASLCFSTENVLARFEAYAWHVQRVADGNHDLAAIDAAIANARAETGRPSIIEVKTIIGYASPKANTAAAHGSPLGDKEVALTKQALGFDPAQFFFVPPDAQAHLAEAGPRGTKAQQDWRRRFEAWAKAFPDLAREWDETMTGRLPAGWDAELPAFKAGDKAATRVVSGKVLNAIAAKVPAIMGGDADLSGSTKTALSGQGPFCGPLGEGRNIHFGVREHAMGSIANGLAYHGGVLPYTATFFSFADYMRPPVRLAAMNRLHVIFVWTHDSIAVGEDGPTHQPVEQMMGLRTIPGLVVLRPADATETAEAWRLAVEHRSGPVALILTRQDVPVLDRGALAPAAGLRRGAYVLAEAEGGAAQALIIATGSEVALALGARELLAKEGVRVRVVSMPSWELFAAESEEYRRSVLPETVPARVAVEAGVTLGWERWIGRRGIVIGLDRYGVSAPAKVNAAKFGFTSENVAAQVKKALAQAGR
jgi:transketolase